MQSSIGQSESETASHLPPMAHALVSHTVASWRSWFWPYKHMALQANVSANAKEHSSLCSVCVLGGKEVKARISLLVTCYSFVLSFSSVFPLVLIYSHHHWALPPCVGCWSVLDATHTELFALFFFFFSLSLPIHGCLFSLHSWHQKDVWTATTQSKWKGMLLLEDPAEAWADQILNYELAGDFFHLSPFSFFWLLFSLSIFLTLIKMCRAQNCNEGLDPLFLFMAKPKRNRTLNGLWLSTISLHKDHNKYQPHWFSFPMNPLLFVLV